MVDERGVAFRHTADVFQGERVGHAVPYRVTLTLQLIEGIIVGVGLQYPVGQTGAYFATANVLESTESPLA